jgi:exosome complex RNA-binding protein Rrp42 (RNase PH superfamily)
MCTIGRTSVMCCIQYEISTPLLHRDPAGRFDVKIEAENMVESKRIRLEEFFSKRVLPSLVDEKDLVIPDFNLVWVLKLTFTCLNDDGSLIDAMVYGFQSSLASLKLPTDLVMVGSSGEVRIKSFAKPRTVPFTRVNVVSVCLVEPASWVADPTFAEEAVLDSVFVLVVDVARGGIWAVGN